MQSYASNTALNGIFIIAAIAATHFARDFLLPVVLATFIALTFRPFIRSLAKRGIAPALATTFIAAGLIGCGFLTVYFLGAPLAAWIGEAPAIARALAEKLRGLQSSLAAVSDLADKVQGASAPGPGAPVQEVTMRQSSLPGIISLATGYPVQLAVMLSATSVIAVFLMASGDLFYEKLIRVLPRMTDKKRALRIVYSVEHEVSVYLLSFAAINAGLGLAVALSFHALGMPSPYLWGVFVFFLNFIPYVGALTGLALSASMAVVVFDTLTHALLVPLAYGFWAVVESQFVTPQILERRLQMNSVAILLALAFWTWLWGIGGAIIAVPLLVAFKVFCDRMEGFDRIGEFLSAREAAKEPADDAETAGVLPAFAGPAKAQTALKR
jgi:predicted PurR-regulated permease PerM